MTITGECMDNDHSWVPAEPQEHRTGGLVSKISCGRCGVGHSILVRQTAPDTLETQLTIFPATGSNTISRRVIRGSVAAWEESNRLSEERGMRIVRVTPVIGGTPVGL